MSLILDALRKSERARQQTLTGQVSVTPAPMHGRLPTPWVSLIGVILLANAVVLALLLWRANQSGPATAVRTAAMLEQTVPVSKPTLRSLASEAGEPDAQAFRTQSLASTEAKPPAAATAVASSTAAQTNQAVAAALDTLPLAFQQSLPALHLDVHGYASNPAERFVIINMQRYVAGDTLREGPHVIAITPRGVILEYQGTRFLLPRN